MYLYTTKISVLLWQKCMTIGFFTMIIFFTDEPNLNMRVISDLKPNELDPFLMILNVHCEDFIS